MSSIQSLGISGIRGYSSQSYQKIQFMKPLTLIYGKNGSGKTTIIQCLKFITTGVYPPNSDKGKSFIMDTKIAGKPQVVGDIRLIFKAGNRAILAKRRMQLSLKGSTYKFQSIQQVLKTKNQKGQQLTINHQCAQIQKQVPYLLGITRPILSNIVFCHQDQSLWPFSDSNTLKEIFDELFQTKRITKQIQRVWQYRLTQQHTLKELKVRLQFYKTTFQRQLQQRTKQYDQLQQLGLRSAQFMPLKKQLRQLKLQLKDNTSMIEQRQKLIHKKGTIQSTITSLKQKQRIWKQRMYKLYTQHQKKLKLNKSINQFGSSTEYDFRRHQTKTNNSFGVVSNWMDVENVQMIEIQSVQRTVEKIQQKNGVIQQLKNKYVYAKEQEEYLRNYNQLGKRELQIRSQIDRVKSILPQIKHNKSIKNNEDFLNVLRMKLSQMQTKIKGINGCKNKLSSISIPNLVELGFSQTQVNQLKGQKKQLQTKIQQTSVVILKTYKAQYKPIPGNILASADTFKHGKTLQSQLQDLQAIIKSKQKDIQLYRSLPPLVDKKSIKEQISHFRYAGIQLQEQMLHFCQQKKKCYFCQKPMTVPQIQFSKNKVNAVKIKTQEKIKQMQKDLNQNDDNDNGNGVDPQMMIKLLTQQVRKLQDKRNIIKIQVNKYLQIKKHQKQIILNKMLQKEMMKCNLKLQMLDKITSAAKDKNPFTYYENVQSQVFVQMCSNYQIILTRYHSVKQQVSKFQTNQQKNQLITRKRQQLIKQKYQLQQVIKKGIQQVKNIDFLKSSCQKLQILIKADLKSKTNKNKNNKPVNQQNIDSSSHQQQGKYSSVQQAQVAINQLYTLILQQKLHMERLQISLGYHNQTLLLDHEMTKFNRVTQQIYQLTKQLKTSQKTLNEFNQKHVYFKRESQRIQSRLEVLIKLLEQPLQPNYLSTVQRIKHLQASIFNLEMIYKWMQKAISTYHATKMDEINQIIYEIWREIYHGDDIQYIQIETQAEKDNKRKKKNFMYKVLMKKTVKDYKDPQMVEMKGRCSTGQKVLASIVIRLALAEVFCSNTRILALDQPTTNLDRQHIRNLAVALMKLIQMSGGKDLQLIIISHDIEFIKMLEEYADSYYQVSRDQNKFSKIQKKSINQIFSNERMFEI